MFLEAKSYETLGDLAMAASIYERGLDLGLPASLAKQAYVSLAAYYSSTGEVSAFRPKSAEDFFNRGLIYNSLGQHELALQDLDEAIGMSQGQLYGGDPRYFLYYYHRGLTYFNINKYDLAISDLEASMQFEHPGRAEALVLMGLAHDSAGQTEQALQMLAEIRPAVEEMDIEPSVNPDEAELHRIRGLALNILGEHLRAIEFFDEATRIDPESAKAHRDRGIANNALAQYQEALEDFDEAIRLDSEDAVAYLGRAITQRGLGEPELALDDLNEALALVPHYSQALKVRSQTYADLDQTELAFADRALAARTTALLSNAKYVDKIGRYPPKGAWDYFDLSLASLALGQYDQAIEQIDQARELAAIE